MLWMWENSPKPWPPYAAEEADDFHGLAVDDLHLLVGAVGDVEEALRFVGGERHAETGAEPGGGLALDEDLLHERSVEAGRTECGC